MDNFKLLVVTTPQRIMSPRGKQWFIKERQQYTDLDLIFLLKRKEPRVKKDEKGQSYLDWTKTSTDRDMEWAHELLTLINANVWWVIEDHYSQHDAFMVKKYPDLKILICGGELTPEKAKEIKNKIRADRENKGSIYLALENETMLAHGNEWLSSEWAGLVMGSSYLSESSKIYDQMGLERFRSVIKALGRKAEKRGQELFTTSNYCSFEKTGVGDKSPEFVREQIEWIAGHQGWGCLTRFYRHVKIINEKVKALKKEKAEHGK